MYRQRRDDSGGGGGAGFLWGGLACCCAGAGCYLLGRSYDKSANELRSAREFCRISDLSMTLSAASSGFIPLVSLSGRVGSDTPIIGEQSGLEAVIVENDVTQTFLKKKKRVEDDKEYMVVKKTKDKDGTEKITVREKKKDDEEWIRCSEQISSKRKEVPWYLDDGTGRVEVAGARNADGFILRLASEDFEKQPRTCGCESSIKILGLRRTEWTLPTGTNLNVVGEAVKGDSGEILIKRPRNGGPFHISRSSIDKIVSNLGSDARWCHFWAVTFATSGALLLGIGGYAMC
ncbi:unnamed protein product [Urochloa decumbens]|uniref:RING-type E3 ubiquitin transferase n=1 Tax=Urochloa decumbens TaxID=240449 RepID=A0ABC8WTA0_9POAL